MSETDVHDGALFVTGDEDDPRFNDPYIDLEEWRDEPAEVPPMLGLTTQGDGEAPIRVRHLYVHGGFTGTDAKFSFCFPPPEQYEGRFYQPTHQLLPSEDPRPYNVAMAIAAGAYVVQTNMGGSESARISEDTTSGKFDGTIGGYRVNAAAAKYSREVAHRIYGPHRTYGYLYGGSGGGIQSLNGAENTEGVWDGFVPYVVPAPTATPSGLTVRAHALRVLEDKWPGIIDAFEPGGRDPYEGLNEEEREALEEATRYGFPPRAWFNYVPRGVGPLSLVAAAVPILDPTYQEDFWTKPGYLGSDPSSSAAAARVQHEATVLRVIEGPPRQLELSSLPSGDLTGADLIITRGPAKDQRAPLGEVDGNTAGFGPFSYPAAVDSFQVGDEIAIDNSRYLALQTHHRHQIPPPGSEYDYPRVYDYFRHPDGTPIYPQRDFLIGPANMVLSSGVTNNGRFRGKMILVENLMDGDACPWQADWYRRRAEELLGTECVDQNFRIWFIDNAQHVQPMNKTEETHVVSYQGVLEQALRDVAAWVEQGVTPPANTNYQVVEGQVLVPAEVNARRGIQPIVDLSANGGVGAEIEAGESVSFAATIAVPPGMGGIVAAEWDFEGTGEYGESEPLSDPTAESVNLSHSYRYSAPGIYFPALRATSHRQGDPDTAYARVQNLGRVRVVVR